MDLFRIILVSPVASLIFLVTVIFSMVAFRRRDLARKWMLNPYTLVHKQKYSQVFTSGLIHADWMHLAFNMLSFYFFAISISGVIPLEYWMTSTAGPIGHLYFGLVYLAAMVLGDFSTIYKQKDNPSYYSLGASGAISGVIFSYIIFDPSSKIGIFFFPSMPAPLFAILYVVFSVLAGKSRNTNINHDAHLWGGLVGFALTAALFPLAFMHFLEEVKHLAHFF